MPSHMVCECSKSKNEGRELEQIIEVVLEKTREHWEIESRVNVCGHQGHVRETIMEQGKGCEHDATL